MPKRDDEVCLVCHEPLSRDGSCPICDIDDDDLDDIDWPDDDDDDDNV